VRVGQDHPGWRAPDRSPSRGGGPGSRWARVNSRAIATFMERLSPESVERSAGNWANLGGLGCLGAAVSRRRPPPCRLSAALGMMGPLIFGWRSASCGFLSRGVLGQYDTSAAPRDTRPPLVSSTPKYSRGRARLELGPPPSSHVAGPAPEGHHTRWESSPRSRGCETHFIGLCRALHRRGPRSNSGEAMSRLQALGTTEQMSHLMSHPRELSRC